MEILGKDLKESNNECFWKTHLQLSFNVPRSAHKFFSTYDTQTAL